MESIEKRISTLRLAKWGYKDVETFVGCKADKAYGIIKSANKGSTSTKADRDAVLALLGTTFDKAMEEAYTELKVWRITQAEIKEQLEAHGVAL